MLQRYSKNEIESMNSTEFLVNKNSLKQTIKKLNESITILNNGKPVGINVYPLPVNTKYAIETLINERYLLCQELKKFVEDKN